MTTKQTDRIAKLKEAVSLLPNEPGVYRFYNSDNVVIYVGKAKNLKKRVSSYFLTKRHNELKTMVLVKQIERIEHIVVTSENDALLLENNLIKTLQPKYNILLKDDKTFPWIVVKKEPYPRIIPTRTVIKDGSKYFGPYTNIGVQRQMINLVRELYLIRRCHLKLTEKAISEGKFSRCLQHHLGNCTAPCEAYISHEEYNKRVDMAMELLKGNMAEARKYLREEMMKASEEMRFEDAGRYKNKLDMLDNYNSKSVVVSPQYTNLDIFSLLRKDKSAFCNYMHVQGGAIVNSYTIEMKLKMDEENSEVLTLAITEIMNKLNRRLAREVLVPFLPDTSYFGDTVFNIPLRGDKLKLMQLSERNAQFHQIERIKQAELHNPELKTSHLMDKMRRELHMDIEPRHIECFDNSNIQGEYAVSACVVFRDGKPARRDYRHFNIKTVVGIDDFASMYETVTRRYSRMLEEGAELPQLIVVDGGKGQLSIAYSALESLGLENKITIIGLAKRLEEVFFPKESDPIYLDKTGETLRVLMHIRDEAHRFGITFHRKKRSKGAIHSELESIPNIGKATIKKLLTTFKTINKIKIANFESLSSVVGASKANNIIKHFTNNE